MDDSSATQTLPFLADKEKLHDGEGEEYSRFTNPRAQHWIRRYLKNAWFHAILLLLNIILLAKNTTGFARTTCHPQDLIYSRSTLSM